MGWYSDSCCFKSTRVCEADCWSTESKRSTCVRPPIRNKLMTQMSTCFCMQDSSSRTRKAFNVVSCEDRALGRLSSDLPVFRSQSWTTRSCGPRVFLLDRYKPSRKLENQLWSPATFTKRIHFASCIHRVSEIQRAEHSAAPHYYLNDRFNAGSCFPLHLPRKKSFLLEWFCALKTWTCLT